ncbi:MAG: hypothetical protein COC19_02035 [SAR86 cluster bacterium]|uniref:DUF1499 domain-containing protein n=1 Tax=SAR86 cluster bacterium TaxID=2030880 RepID=A0A2A4MRT0_9GAMM|nr:MAG: hypothetical protein COC19_02035 [SAR86 cluster bacterium]
MKKKLFSLCLPLLFACSSEAPQNLGANNGRLLACPDSPNCVSSFETSEEHGITPLAANLEQIEQLLLTLGEANIIDADENYLRAEFTSSLMRYVDDVEFLRDDGSNITHVRSASRVGHSDMGVNRERIEMIRSNTQ